MNSTPRFLNIFVLKISHLPLFCIPWFNVVWTIQWNHWEVYSFLYYKFYVFTSKPYHFGRYSNLTKYLLVFFPKCTEWWKVLFINPYSSIIHLNMCMYWNISKISFKNKCYFNYKYNSVLKGINQQQSFLRWQKSF